jgi:hypothetical protein
MTHVLTILFCFIASPEAGPECFILRHHLPEATMCQPMASQWEQVYGRDGALVRRWRCVREASA